MYQKGMGGEEEASWLSSLIDQADNLILTIGGYDIGVPDSIFSDNESDSDDDEEEYDSGFEEDHTEKLAARISVGSKVAAAGQENDDGVDVPREEDVTTTARRAMLPSPSPNGKGGGGGGGVHETQDEYGGVEGVEAVENTAGEEATLKPELLVQCSDIAPPQPGTDSSREDERLDKVPERLDNAPDGDSQVVAGMHLPSARGGPLPFALDPMLITPAHSRDRDGLQWEPPQIGLPATGEVSRRIRRDRHRTVSNSSAHGESAGGGVVSMPSEAVSVTSADTLCAKSAMSPSSPLPPADSAEETVSVLSPDTPSRAKTATSPSSPKPPIERAEETVSMLSADSPPSAKIAMRPLSPVESAGGSVSTPSLETPSSAETATSAPVESAGENVSMPSADASSCAKTTTTTRPSSPSPVPAVSNSASGVDKKPDVVPRKRPGKRFSYVSDTTWLRPKEETPEKKPAWQQLGAGVTAKATTSSSPVGRLPSPEAAAVSSPYTGATVGVVPPSTTESERYQASSYADAPLEQDLAAAVAGKEEADAGLDMERLSQDSLDEHLGNGAMDAEEEPAEVFDTVSPKQAVSYAGSPDVDLPEQMREGRDAEMSEHNGVATPTPEGEHPAGASQQGKHCEEGCHEAMEEEGSGLAARDGGHDHDHIGGEEEEEMEEGEEGGAGEEVQGGGEEEEEEMEEEEEEERSPAAVGGKRASVENGVGPQQFVLEDWALDSPKAYAPSKRGKTQPEHLLAVMRHSSRLDDAIHERQLKLKATAAANQNGEEGLANGQNGDLDAIPWPDKAFRPYDSPIVDTDLPAQQARELSRHGLGSQTCIVCSPFRRCLQTAGVVARTLGVASVTVHLEIGERMDKVHKEIAELVIANIGGSNGKGSKPPTPVFSYLDVAGMREALGAGVQLHGIIGEQPPGDESGVEAKERFIATLAKVRQERLRESPVLVIAHGDTLDAAGESLASQIVFEANYCAWAVFELDAHSGYVSESWGTQMIPL